MEILFEFLFSGIWFFKHMYLLIWIIFKFPFEIATETVITAMIFYLYWSVSYWVDMLFKSSSTTELM